MEKEKTNNEERKKVAKSIICFLNDDGEKVDKKEATQCRIEEYDEDGNIIDEALGIWDNNKYSEDDRDM